MMNKRFEWGNGNLDEAWAKWWHQYPDGNMRNLPLIICWGVWLARNKCIFQDKGTLVTATAIQCVSIYSSIPEPEEKKSQTHNKTVHIKEGIPWAFFDGASQKIVQELVLSSMLMKIIFSKPQLDWGQELTTSLSFQPWHFFFAGSFKETPSQFRFLETLSML